MLTDSGNPPHNIIPRIRPITLRARPEWDIGYTKEQDPRRFPWYNADAVHHVAIVLNFFIWAIIIAWIPALSIETRQNIPLFTLLCIGQGV
jgi:hypothetical protein